MFRLVLGFRINSVVVWFLFCRFSLIVGFGCFMFVVLVVALSGFNGLLVWVVGCCFVVCELYCVWLVLFGVCLVCWLLVVLWLVHYVFIDCCFW